MPEDEQQQKQQQRPAPADTAAGDEQPAKRAVDEAAAAKQKKDGDVNRGGGAALTAATAAVAETSPPLPAVAPATLVISGSSYSAGSTTVTAGLAAALRYGVELREKGGKKGRLFLSLTVLPSSPMFFLSFFLSFGKTSSISTHSPTFLSRSLLFSFTSPLTQSQRRSRGLVVQTFCINPGEGIGEEKPVFLFLHFQKGQERRSRGADFFSPLTSLLFFRPQ